MQVSDALHNLLKDKLGILLTQLSSLPHVVEEIATRTKFHNNHVMLISLECFKNLNVVWMSQTLQDINLIHNLLLLAFLFHEVHVDTLNCAELPREPVQPQINLTKGTFSKHFTNFVQF